MPIKDVSFSTRTDHTQEVIDLKRARVNQVCELIVAGCSRAEIKAKTNSFDMGWRSYDALVRAAYAKVETQFQKTLGVTLSDLVGKLERIYDEAIRSGDLGNANQALKSLAALSGKNLNKVEVKIDNSKSMENLSDDELAALIRTNSVDVTPQA